MSLTSTEVFNTEPIPTVSARIPDRSPVKILSPGKFVLGLFARNNNAADHFMLVNTDYRKAADVSFRIPGTFLQEFDLKTATWQSVLKEPSDNRYRVNLAPGDGRLFRFN